MVVSKSISVGQLVKWSGHHVIWLLSGSALIAFLYQNGWIAFSIPWLPISVIGTAVAFYAGFKNNQAYDRMWEARKIWGAIVNSSRSWGLQVDGYITNQFTEKPFAANELTEVKKTLIYRHIGWLYTLRSQLLIATPWEHISQGGHLARTANYYQQNFGIGLVADEVTQTELKHFLPPNELERLINHKNTATQIINEQSLMLTELRAKDMIDDFRHIELVQTLSLFYDHQGKAERIKKFPLPRQYANMSRYFVGIFIALLPFSMIPELLKLGHWGLWL